MKNMSSSNFMSFGKNSEQKSDFDYRLVLLLFVVVVALFWSIFHKKHYMGNIIDVHQRLEISLKDNKSSLQTVIAAKDFKLMEMIKVGQMNKIKSIGLAVSNQQLEFGFDNSHYNNYLIDAIKDYPIFIPIASIRPIEGRRAIRELERVYQSGVKLVRMVVNLKNNEINFSEIGDFLKKVAELKMIVLFDDYSFIDVSEFGKVFKLATEYPQNKFIFTYAGLIHLPYFWTLKALKDKGDLHAVNNIWFDVSNLAFELSSSPYRQQLLWIIRKIGVSQFLFSSNFPVNKISCVLDSIYALGLTVEEEEMVLYKNAFDLLNVE